ncbi:MAG: type II toxin-antitoxin system HicA family toxin [Thermodesulfovibrionales bacterium]|nr:type II toxin-antitoxin system HicA family toxin [Thermodesulfovibrionales bacterium]
MSSRKLIRIVERAGAVFDREGKGDHVIYKRIAGGRLLKAPILQWKSELTPEYCLIVFRQSGLTDEEINDLLD